MNAALVAIGDEIVAGRTVDSNSAFLAERLLSVGVEPVATFAVPDDDAAILLALRRGLEDAEVVFVTGGLGPTADDRTRACVAELTGRPLRADAAALETIHRLFAERDREMPANNLRQAELPEGSEPIPNPIGTAPGFICPVPRPGGDDAHLICLPGVPREMHRMATESVLPWLEARRPDRRFASRVYSTFGLPESRLDELLEGVVEPAEARLAFRAAFPRIQVRTTVSGAAGDDLDTRLDGVEVRVKERLGRHLYAVGDEGLEETVGRLLLDTGLTLAVAESCTGGLIGHQLTEVAGSSAYFRLGITAYHDDAKIRLLDVPPETIQRHGAVSTETAEAMAEGVRRTASADLGLATTGIAGPGGGSDDKPVGTVCIALAWRNGVWSRRYQLADRGRGWIKVLTAQIALDRVRRWVMGSALVR